jgi:hypothetical protein
MRSGNVTGNTVNPGAKRTAEFSYKEICAVPTIPGDEPMKEFGTGQMMYLVSRLNRSSRMSLAFVCIYILRSPTAYKPARR